MTDTVYRMVLFHSLNEPRHTAFNVSRGRTAHRIKSGQIPTGEKDKPPPGWHSLKGHTHAALKAADPALRRKTGCVFLPSDTLYGAGGLRPV